MATEFQWTSLKKAEKKIIVRGGGNINEKIRLSTDQSPFYMETLPPTQMIFTVVNGTLF